MSDYPTERHGGALNTGRSANGAHPEKLTLQSTVSLRVRRVAFEGGPSAEPEERPLGAGVWLEGRWVGHRGLRGHSTGLYDPVLGRRTRKMMVCQSTRVNLNQCE